MPLITEDLSLPFTVGNRGVFGKIELHREPTDFALQCGDAGLVFGDDAGLSFFTCQLAPVELRHTKLDQVSRDVMAALRIAPPDDASPDVLAELQFKRCRMSTVGTSGCHGAFSMQGPSSVSDL